MRKLNLFFFLIFIQVFLSGKAQNQSESILYFGIPTNNAGIGFGNSPKFNGLRINIAISMLNKSTVLISLFNWECLITPEIIRKDSGYCQF